MSRSGYAEDLEPRDLAMWRGRVASAIRGKRGQKLLRDLRDALDAIPEKRLIDGELVNEDGEVCALGAAGLRRSIAELEVIDPSDHEVLGQKFDVSPCLIGEIEAINDDDFGFDHDDPEQRWKRMRRWVEENIKE